MDGTLFEFECPRCGYVASLANPCLYLDSETRTCVYLVANENMAHGVEGMFDELAESDGSTGGPGVRRRIALDRYDLRGRAIALANGLDDRAVQLLKVALIGSAKLQGAVPEEDDACVASLAGMEGDDLVFEL